VGNSKNMTRLTIVILLLTISSFSFGQECKTFQDYEVNGQKIADLDSPYPSALSADTTIAVFHSREDEFYEAWVSLLNDLAQHLANNDFTWGKPTWCFNKIYFNKDGKIDKYLFNFRKLEVEEDKQAIFAKLLTEFAKDYKLKIDKVANSNFSQCGPVIYKDKEKRTD